MTDFIGDLARSIAFLSRLPVPDRFFEGQTGSVSRGVRTFPAAGLVIALVPCIVLMLAAPLGQEPMLACLLALALITLMTGALHEDGLADAADGLGGGRDRDHALAIMRDSRIGSYGAVALILSFGLRAAALTSLADLGGVAAAFSLLATAAVSRAALVAHWRALPAARTDGTAAAAGRPEREASRFAMLSAVVLALVLLLPVFGPAPCVIALAVTAAVAYGFTRHVDKRLGGHTGDTIGATQQLSEIAMLAALALAS